ncbi:MAG: hypothetical protein KAS29_09940 [Bacteroidales bacterium]|nr:hypothetical protein [Bacteroidales bacterium]
MIQDNGKMELIETSQNTTAKPARTGLHKYFHVSRLDTYLSAIVAIVFAIFGFIELFNIAELSFIKMSNSFQFVMLFGIFGMVARIYYKLFEEQYDKKS